MFTVIFAEKENIKLFEETKMFFGPLYNSKQIAFCEWHKDEVDFDSMVPGLYSLIEHKSEWRAIILYDDCKEKLNPFDYTDYSEPFFDEKNKNFDYYKERFDKRVAAYEKAVSNPLVKLTTALSNVTGFRTVVSDDDYTLLFKDGFRIYEYMLKKQLEVLNCSELAARLSKYQRDDLKRFVSEENVEQLVQCVKFGDASGILDLIPGVDIPAFIRYVGNDPIYYDPEYTACLIENTKKDELLTALSAEFSMKSKLPTEILCISPRTFDLEKVEQDINWKKKDEISSSKFSNFNLYSDRLKYILFDILPEDNMQFKFMQIKYMCMILIVANNDMPRGLINANNVYRISIAFNSDIVSQICEEYLSKLKSTQILLKDIEMQIDCDSETSVDNRTAKRLFESDFVVPVEINYETSEDELYAEYKSIGLSTDCPVREDNFWAKQYRKISKQFIRYLREPRRAVKTAVSEVLHKNNFIDDDRALLLSEFQIEDVNFHIAELEQQMVETTTTHLFNTKEYTKQIQEADTEIKREIAQRMTKKKTILVGLISVLAYLIGFLPLLFGNLNTGKSFTFSLMLTAILLGLFMVCGFIYLFVLKKKLIDRFRHFNSVMSDICSQINSALGRFSKYLSCTCNLMRDFSVLKERDSEVVKKKRILAYHNIKISEQIKNVHEMFSRYVDFENIEFKETKPYENDYTKLKEYVYEMPSIHSNKKIEYLQAGNEITIPIDYVEKVSIIREELYD